MTAGEGPGRRQMLVLATVAFASCFYAWSLLGPLGPDLQDRLALSELELSALVAVPVLLGSLMRIPLGFLTDRHGGRLIFSALMAWTILPLLALAVWHESYATLIALSFLLGFAGASFAVGVPFVSRWYPPAQQGSALGIYGVGMGGTSSPDSPPRRSPTRGESERRSLSPRRCSPSPPPPLPSSPGTHLTVGARPHAHRCSARSRSSAPALAPGR